MSLADSAASGAAKLFGAQAIRALTQIAGVVVLSRLLLPGDFGLVAMVAAVANIAVVLGDFGLSAAAIQSRDISQQQRSNLFWTNVVLGLVLTLGVALLGWPLAAFYGRSEIIAITQVIAISFVLNAAAAQFRAELSRSLRFGRLAVVDIIAPAAALTAAIGAAVAGLGYWALVIQPVTMSVTALICVAIVARWLPGLPRRAPMRHLYGFGAGTLGIQIATYVSTNIDDVLVGRAWGAAEAGFYSRAFQLSRLPMQQIAVPIARVALPILARIQDDPPRFVAYALRGQLVLAYVFGGMFFLLAALSDPLVDIALGDGWGAAKPIFLALAVGGIFQSITTGYWWMFQAKGLVSFALRFSLFGRSAMVALLFLGLPWAGVGVACASAAGQALMWALYTGFALPRAGIPRRKVLLQAVTPLVCGTVAMAGGLVTSNLSAKLGDWAQLFCVLTTFVFLVALLFISIKPFRRDLRLIAATAMRMRRAR